MRTSGANCCSCMLAQVQAYIEALINTAASSSTLAYLRILHLARSSTSTLVDDIKSHSFFRTASSVASTSTTLTSPIGHTFAGSGSDPGGAALLGSSAAGGIGVAAVSAMLDHAMDELFVPYMEGTRYLEREGKSLTELYASKLLRFTNWHVSPHTDCSGCLWK